MIANSVRNAARDLDFRVQGIEVKNKLEIQMM